MTWSCNPARVRACSRAAHDDNGGKGCGADAAPFFRIFNPVSQGEKFDPAGDYVMRWVPELRGLTPEWIHRPSQAPPDLLRQAGIELGRSYPKPIVDHSAARSQALAAFERL